MSKKRQQQTLLNLPPVWSEKWGEMPEFSQKDLAPWQSIRVHFKTPEDRQEFASRIGQKLTNYTRSVWFPPDSIWRYADKRYAVTEGGLPRYPIYVISKGRAKSRLTAKSLEAMDVPYRIVIEPQERKKYAAVIDPSKILVLPFSNLGQGSIPARNWVWEHSLTAGNKRHWILDDNINGFFRLNRNLKVPMECGGGFRAVEDFSDRYSNVGLSGFNYFMFASRKCVMPPFVMNTRIYSCILVNNEVPFRWRGRYNEDTDLSLRVLKAKWCTILFNAFLACKTTTMKMKGGNTDELYAEDGRRKMAESLFDQHPDVVTIVKKWNRWQHQVNYSPFKRTPLIPVAGAELSGVNNYGMVLEKVDNGRAKRGGKRK